MFKFRIILLEYNRSRGVRVKMYNGVIMVIIIAGVIMAIMRLKIAGDKMYMSLCIGVTVV